MSGAYYNEIDPFAAEWLRNLIKAGLIAPGNVDERDIRDVRPSEVREYTQCHFFAGIGVWSLALRDAGWPDDKPVWTGSCPCQPFSSAGGRGGFTDERHLWPALFHLIENERPEIVLGEQVASKDGLTWLDLVQTDMEGAGYVFEPLDLCAAGFGAPHIRQRSFFVGVAYPEGLGGRAGLRNSKAAGCRIAITGDDGAVRQLAHPLSTRRAERRTRTRHGSATSGSSSIGRMADADGGNASAEWEQRSGKQRQFATDCGVGRMADDDDDGFQGRSVETLPGARRWHEGNEVGRGSVRLAGSESTAGATNGIWGGADWLFCTDGRWRPVEPGAFPLAHGAPARVGRLRAYGNAINKEVAQGFIDAVRYSLAMDLV